MAIKGPPSSSGVVKPRWEAISQICLELMSSLTELWDASPGNPGQLVHERCNLLSLWKGFL